MAVSSGYLVDSETGRRVEIGARLLAGRSEDSDFRIADPAASRRHFEIVRNGDAFQFRDLNSRNGSLLNDIPAISGHLRHGDTIKIGDRLLRFEMIEEAAAPTGPLFDSTLMVSPPSDELRKSCSLLETLYQVMNEIANEYDPCRLLDHILRTAMPAINAQRGALFLANDAGTIAPCPACGLTHRYIEGRLSPDAESEMLISGTVAERVLTRGESVLYQDCDKSGEFEAVHSVMRLELRSIICVPLRSKSRILGILYVDTNRPGQCYNQEDLLLAAAVGNSAGIALDNMFMHRMILDKQRMEQEIRTAWAIQDGFLFRDWEKADARIEVFAETLPAKTVGGDFYDFLQPEPDVVGILIGDVSGKGVPAALTMAQLLAEFRLLARETPSPARIMTRLNSGLTKRSRRGMFCTLCYARLNLRSGELTWANAGHPPGLLLTRQAGVFFGEASGPPIGIVDDASWQDETRTLAPGTSVLLYTDGVIEAHPKTPDPQEFGMDRLWEAAEYGMSPKETIHAVTTAVNVYLGGAEAHDDLTMICLRHPVHDQ